VQLVQDALAYYPENQRSTDAYLRKVVQGNQKEGFEPQNGSSASMLGSAAFARQDFQKGTRYEAVLVRAYKVHAIVFIFAGSDRDGSEQADCSYPAKARFGAFALWLQRSERNTGMRGRL
jgi:hypothetical protein